MSKEVKPNGRPTLYKPEYDAQVLKLCLLGATDKDIASFFEVNVDTYYEWLKKHPSFTESVKRGKHEADANVATSLYKKAMGTTVKEIDIRVIDGKIIQTVIEKHLPPDTGAAIFWLKNRKPEQWRDRVNLNHQLGIVDIQPIEWIDTPQSLRIDSASTNE